MCVVSINVPEEILLDLHDGVSIFSFGSENEFLEELANA